jgi:hypothetical protein
MCLRFACTLNSPGVRYLSSQSGQLNDKSVSEGADEAGVVLEASEELDGEVMVDSCSELLVSRVDDVSSDTVEEDTPVSLSPDSANRSTFLTLDSDDASDI